MLSRVSTPLPANPQMENLFEPAFLGGVLKIIALSFLDSSRLF